MKWDICCTCHMHYLHEYYTNAIKTITFTIVKHAIKAFPISFLSEEESMTQITLMQTIFQRKYERF